MILKKIIGTFSNKLLATGLSFLLVVASSKILGASGKGEISLFIANITLITHFGNLIAGTALTYLTPRIKPSYLLLPAYIWSVFSALFISMVLWFSGYVHEGWLTHLIILSTAYGLMSTNYMILLGREKVGVYNTLTLLTVAITLAYFAAMHWLNAPALVIDYIYALYAAYGVIFISSIISIRHELSGFSITESLKALPQITKYGVVAQISNIVTFINYRFSYYVLEYLFDESTVGVFSVGVAISEAMWLMSKSIALVQYTRIVNENDIKRAQNMTFQMAKLSFWITSLFIIVMWLMPDIFYEVLFGAEFIDAKYVIYSLSIGVLSIATSTTFVHYFGGMGKFYINNIASIVGVVFTLSLTYFMAIKYGMVGAGASASVSYFAAATYLYFKFRKETGYSFIQLRITKSDLNKLLYLFNNQNH